MHILKSSSSLPAQAATRSAAFTGRGITFSQGDRIHGRGSKSESINGRSHGVEIVYIGRCIILSQCNTFYRESDIGNRCCIGLR